MKSKKTSQMDKSRTTSYNADESLRAHGINPTSQRLTIANMLFSRHQHMSAEQICEVLSSKHIKVSQATVYNTLGLFVEKGLLKEIHVNSVKIFYDTNTKAHQHFYNIDTGEVIDIKKPLEYTFIEHELPSATKIDSIDTIVRIRSHSS